MSTLLLFHGPVSPTQVLHHPLSGRPAGPSHAAEGVLSASGMSVMTSSEHLEGNPVSRQWWIDDTR